MMNFFFNGGFFTIFFIIFILAFAIIISVFVREIKQWNKNNHSPRLDVMATVVSKRTEYRSHHHNNGDMMNTSHYTSYFVTFQVESGDRMELSVKGSDYGMLVENDFGRLSFQGTRYLGFERQR